MARMRYVKPEFWTDGVMVNLSPFARLLFIGSWNFALCDNGHLPDDPVQLKLQILPMDDVDAASLIQELVDAGRLTRVQTPDGRRFLHIRRLSHHQKVEKRWSPRCLACSEELDETPPSTPGHEETPEASTELSETPETSLQEGMGGEGRGTKKPAASSRPRKRGTRIPDDFAVTPEMVDWAREKVPNVDGRRETEKFINYWQAKSGQTATKLDWAATWRNWMLNAQERAPARASPNGMHPTDANIAAMLRQPTHLRAIPGGDS